MYGIENYRYVFDNGIWHFIDMRDGISSNGAGIHMSKTTTSVVAAINSYLSSRSVTTIEWPHAGENFCWLVSLPADMSEEDIAYVKEAVGWKELMKKEIVGILQCYRN